MTPEEERAWDSAVDGARRRNARAAASADVQEDEAPPEVLPDPLPGGRLLDLEWPPVEYAIAPYFPRGEFIEIAGAHGLYKSTLALGACLSVATERPWGPCMVEGGASAFITLEDSERTLGRRVKAWLRSIPEGAARLEAKEGIRARFRYLPREQARELALTSTVRTSTAARPQVVDHLSAVLEGCAFVTLETATRLHEGPESNEALAVFAQAVERIAVGTGAAVAVPRHVGKVVAREGTADSYSGRGGGAFSDAARSVLVVTRERKQEDGEDPDELPLVRVTHAKATHSAPARPVDWRPVLTDYGVYLALVAAADVARADAGRLLDHLRQLGPEGLARSALHKSPPAGLSRAAAQRALEELLAGGQVRPVERRRGHGQVATVYVATEVSE